MGDAEFDEWFNDQADAENQAGFQNQCAKFGDKSEEERTRQEGTFGPAVALAGQFFAKFEDAADPDKKYIKSFSGHIYKKEDDETYIALTAAHCLQFTDVGGNPAPLKNGFFFLQKSVGDFTARFSFSAEDDDVKIFTDYEEVDKDNQGLSGQDIAAVKLTLKMTKTEIPEVQDPEIVEASLEDDYTMSGYPDQSIRVLSAEEDEAGESKFTDEGKTLFSHTGKLDHIDEVDNGKIAVYSMDATKGQDGGALTDAEGKVIGIFSQVQNTHNDDFYCATILGENFFSWFNDLSF